MTQPTLVVVPRALVVDASGAAAADTAAIAAGIPSRALMRCAGAAAAAEIARRFPERLPDGVAIATGAGNNGGDGWVVAQWLHAAGIAVQVIECAEARTPDARAERDAAIALGIRASRDGAALVAGHERVLVDALLGTGFHADADLREPVAGAIAKLAERAARGALLVALDVPSGLDASSGASRGGLRAALTLSFGTVKRGQLVGREHCGEIIVLDIGLGRHALAANGAPLADARWFRAMLPLISADAHKGTRGKVAIIGGARGMAGAAVVAARAALHSGAGLVKCVVAPESISVVQEAVPAALAGGWPSDDATARHDIGEWADAVLIGPGLGRDDARVTVERLLRSFSGPVVLDADALNAFADDADALAPLLRNRAALLTPHPMEFARLAGDGATVDDVLGDRFERPARLARRTGAAVLLKGVPTVVAAPSGATTIVAEGTPILATGGAGDLLGGVAVTLLAQTGDAALAGALAAFAHGRSAARVDARTVRGYTLDDVLRELPGVWAIEPGMARPPVIGELPAVGEPR
jgi:NAD(P)H-hydrate epimerase